MNLRNERMEEILRELAGKFLNLYASKSSLITVTGSELSKNKKNVTIFFTVFPDDMEKTALEFCQRKTQDFWNFVKDNSKISMIPKISFQIDYGEKNRQKIDELLNQ